MDTLKLKTLVENSDMGKLEKLLVNGFIDRANARDNKRTEDFRLIEETDHNIKIADILCSTDTWKIYKVYGKGWDHTYPYRSIFLKDGKWVRVHTVSPSFEIAFLLLIDNMNLGPDSQFTDFAMKMLGITLRTDEE